MTPDGWKKLAEAMRRREEEEAWRLHQRLTAEEIADQQLLEMGRGARKGSDPAYPARKRTRRRP